MFDQCQPVGDLRLAPLAAILVLEQNNVAIRGRARGDLAGYHLLPSVRANLLNRLGRRAEARAAYQEALVLAKLDPERRLIVKRLAELD